MPDESVLKKTARDKIHHGRLPESQPDRTTWVGAGSGEACAVCDEVVSPDRIGMEIEFWHAEPLKHALHAECFLAWEVERAEAERDMQRGSS